MNPHGAAPRPMSADGPLPMPHSLPRALLLEQLSSHAQSGLESARVEQIRHEQGWNELASAPGEPVWKRFLSQFRNVVIWILLVAALIAGLTADWTDAAAIIAIVLLNAVLGFFQEERAQQALAALRKLAAPVAKVVRESQWQQLPARELVPGDIVELDAGDQVPADVRLLKGAALHIQEAALTGESVPVDKDAELELPAETPLAERRNMAYLGTVVAHGTARGVVVATGMHTEIGRIAGLLELYDRKPTPLQRQLELVGRTLVAMCLAIVAVIFALSLLRGDQLLEALLTAVSLAVAAVPEGLPAVVTTALALGLQRMAQRNALIRKLPSVETLGCVTVICTDKTGTLTHNEMTVRELHAGGAHYRVTGSGYSPYGDFWKSGPADEPVEEHSGRLVNVADEPALQQALLIGALCNHAQVVPNDEPQTWKVIGDPTEGALIVLAMKGGLDCGPAAAQILRELPFDSERKLMSVMLKQDDGRMVQYTKGAPEVLLDRCRYEWLGTQRGELKEVRRQELLQLSDDFAGRALRVLACGFREPPPSGDLSEAELTFVGLIGMLDPPRAEVRSAIALCHDAGIRTVMITGDHPVTATAIGREVGILAGAERVMTGAALDHLSDDELAVQAEQIAVYARVAPEHKLRVVRALQARGQVVAMTGDGVNDAPAVKAADIGIAMGRTGTDVTRESAAMVLLDDNFTSIVSAVEEGRSIYENIQKFLVYLLSCNAGEMLLMLFGGLLGWPAPLLPIQLLWINLVTDGFPALALAMEPAEPDLMRRRPRQASETILSWSLGAVVLGQGALLAAVGLTAFGLGLAGTGNVDHARTLAFNAVVFDQLFRALAARSRVWTFWQLGAFTNPYLFAAVAISTLLQISILSFPFARPIFEATSHTPAEWLLLIGLALAPVTAIEVAKLTNQWLAGRRKK
jgi:Ca2+-transporting ATPase